MVRVLQWGNKATNDYFRAVYEKGDNLWIHRTKAEKAVQDGWAMTDSCHLLVHMFCQYGIGQLYPNID